ncbi:hypothetical protein DRE_07564 [Drechslerella stenobrocha 248]|uniref:DUF7357 domain-containing protein n=1 Tax=Drechslerella stenobrocha 248 TaxID=1043628 RepID=W7HKD6_9PEZI|nr:hypothetical protein DRE_07564 [Drechslerella stenobrocha 248]
MRRARLLIRRPQLPQVHTLWPLDKKISQNPRYSVHDLITDVNDFLQLEVGNLGLEDYVAEIAECELLHYMLVEDLVGDNDEITIRPLTRDEIRERVRGGRRQISTSGRKLVDGVPIGRNFVAPAPDRPRIQGAEPPLKRRRTKRTDPDEYEDMDMDMSDMWGTIVDSSPPKAVERPRVKSAGSRTVRFGEEDDAPRVSSALVLAVRDDDGDDDDESDDDYNPDSRETEDSDASASEEELEQSEEPAAIRKSSKENENAVTAKESSDASSDSDDSDADSESDDSDDSDDSESLESDEGSEGGGSPVKLNIKPPKVVNLKSSSSTSDSSSDSDDSSDDESVQSSQLSDSGSSSSEDDSDSGSDSESSDDESEGVPEEVSSKVGKQPAKPTTPPTAPKSVPFEGSSTTKSRNQRRRETKALAKLIKNQVLPAGSTKQDMRKLLGRDQPQDGDNGMKAAKSRAAGSSASSGASQEGIAAQTVESGSQAEEPLQSQSGQSPAYTPMAPFEVIVDQMEVVMDVPVTSSQPAQSDEVSSSPVGAGRRRPVASDAAKRLILGGLGLRKPRNPAEDEQLRSDWKKANSKYVGNKSKGFLDSMAGKEGAHSRFDEDGAPTTVVRQVESDPNVWVKRVHLSAVECDDEYSDANGNRPLKPTFPFDQRQLFQNNGASNRSNKKNKNAKNKNKRKHQEDVAYEEGDWNASYYDEQVMQVDSAQRPVQVEHSTQGADDEADDDMPPVPSNLSDYPKLEPPVLPESIVVFQIFALDPQTIRPGYKQCTAQILSVDGVNIRYQLAKRDCPKIDYDEETGDRKFGKFHMPGMEDEEADSGIGEISIQDMIDARVIKAGVEPAKNIVEEPESERVPETVHGESLDKDDIDIQQSTQGEYEDLPMEEHMEDVEPEQEEDGQSRLSMAAQASSFQSSSFVEPPFQRNGSCGYGHSESGCETDQEDGTSSLHNGDGDNGSNANRDDHIDSSAEAYRFDDAPSPELHPQDTRPPIVSRQADSTLFPAAAEKQSVPASDPVIQVGGTPEPGPLRSRSTSVGSGDVDFDLSALEPAEADKIKQMIKVKEECPEDTELLRERLMPFHHPAEVLSDGIDISIDISSPVSPKVKRERLSTQEALESPISALKDITDRSAHNNGVEVEPETHGADADADDSDVDTRGPGPSIFGNNQLSPAPALVRSSTSPYKRSDGTLQRRRKIGAHSHRQLDGERRTVSAPTPPPARVKLEDDDLGNGDDDDFAVPSTMPVRSLTSGRTAVSGRQPSGLIIVSSDDDEPRASLEIVGGGDVPVRPGKPKILPQLVKRRHVHRDSPGPESSQWRRVSSQQ